MLTIGQRFSNVDFISWKAAVVFEVTTPIRVGYLGIDFLWDSSNKPSDFNLAFKSSKAC